VRSRRAAMGRGRWAPGAEQAALADPVVATLMEELRRVCGPDSSIRRLAPVLEAARRVREGLEGAALSGTVWEGGRGRRRECLRGDEGAADECDGHSRRVVPNRVEGKVDDMPAGPGGVPRKGGATGGRWQSAAVVPSQGFESPVAVDGVAAAGDSGFYGGGFRSHCGGARKACATGKKQRGDAAESDVRRRGASPPDFMISDAAILSLPGPLGEAGMPLVDLCAAGILPSVLARFYSDEASFRRPIAGRAVRGVHLVANDQVYAEVLARMVAAGMVAFECARTFPARDGTGRRVLNGLFQYPKPGSDKRRLITDARPANSIMLEPADPGLPSPETLLRDVRYLAHRGVAVSSLRLFKEDAKDYYHRLLVPAAMRRYQCLRPLSVEAVDVLHSLGVRLPSFPPGQVVPVLLTLAMGLAPAVLLGQAVMAERMRLAVASLPASLTRDVISKAYIDDGNIIAPEGPGRAVAVAFRRQMEKDCILQNAAKSVDGVEVGEVMGIELDFRLGTYGLSPRRLVAISQALHAVASEGVATIRELQQIMGRAAWALLCCRPLFSLCFFVYRFEKAAARVVRGDLDKPCRVWPCVRRELDVLARLLPFCFAPINTPRRFSVISDASDRGGGAGISRLVPILESASQLARAPVRQGASPPVVAKPPPRRSFAFWQWRYGEGARGRLAAAGPWHITRKELHALEAGVARAVMRSGLDTPSDELDAFAVVVFVDNMSALHAVQKGRSRSFAMNAILRRHGLLQVSNGVSLEGYYVPSADNPADIWSRRWWCGKASGWAPL
jgi:hypothetical protein